MINDNHKKYIKTIKVFNLFLNFVKFFKLYLKFSSINRQSQMIFLKQTMPINISFQ